MIKIQITDEWNNSITIKVREWEYIYRTRMVNVINSKGVPEVWRDIVNVIQVNEEKN